MLKVSLCWFHYTVLVLWPRLRVPIRHGARAPRHAHHREDPRPRNGRGGDGGVCPDARGVRRERGVRPRPHREAKQAAVRRLGRRRRAAGASLLLLRLFCFSLSFRKKLQDRLLTEYAHCCTTRASGGGGGGWRAFVSGTSLCFVLILRLAAVFDERSTQRCPFR
jgi:hypothetical protein